MHTNRKKMNVKYSDRKRKGRQESKRLYQSNSRKTLESKGYISAKEKWLSL